MQSLQAVAIENKPMPSFQREENLPFTVSLVQDEASLIKAVQMRQSAYGRHVPELARSLNEPEKYDYEPGTAVLLTESKMDGEPLGTMRIQTNRHGPLGLEQSVTLPDWLRGCSLAEATRLGVSRGHIGRLVKTAMFKAYYQYCAQNEIDWMVITGRKPLDRQYDALLFQDVYPEKGFIPMQHVGNIPHRVLALEVEAVQSTWQNADHPLYDFFFHTHHADISVGVDEIAATKPESGSRVVPLHQHLPN